MIVFLRLRVIAGVELSEAQVKLLRWSQAELVTIVWDCKSCWGLPNHLWRLTRWEKPSLSLILTEMEQSLLRCQHCKIIFLQTNVYWSISIVWRSLTTTGAWDGDDAAWTFADRGGAEKDGCWGWACFFCFKNLVLKWHDLIFIHIPI